jgi:hypothetical protein
MRMPDGVKRSKKRRKERAFQEVALCMILGTKGM